jgi:hypothetical protein
MEKLNIDTLATQPERSLWQRTLYAPSNENSANYVHTNVVALIFVFILIFCV